jgi:hypothetical protein
MIRDCSSVRLIWSLGRGPGSAAWVPCRRPSCRWLGGLGLASGELGLVVGLLAGVALGGARLDLALGRGDGRQAVLAALEFIGHAHPVGDVGTVGLRGQRQQLLDLGLELRLDGLGMPIGQGAVTAGIGVDLGAVEADACRSGSTGSRGQPGAPRQTPPRTPCRSACERWPGCRGRGDGCRRCNETPASRRSPRSILRLE